MSALSLAMSGPVEAKVEGDTITFGAALSFTGKYSTNGQHAKNGYELAVTRINDAGGIKVGGKSYKIQVQYYDDESTPARLHRFCSRFSILGQPPSSNRETGVSGSLQRPLHLVVAPRFEVVEVLVLDRWYQGLAFLSWDRVHHQLPIPPGFWIESSTPLRDPPTEQEPVQG